MSNKINQTMLYGVVLSRPGPSEHEISATHWPHGIPRSPRLFTYCAIMANTDNRHHVLLLFLLKTNVCC